MGIRRKGNRIRITRAGLVFAATLLAALTGLREARAQPAPSEEMGCCCVTTEAGQGCGQTTQKSCLAKQPKAPEFDAKTGEPKAEEDSAAQEKKPMNSGWRAGPCPTK